MRVTLIVLSLIAVLAVGGLVLISLGVGLGAALNWMLPSIGLGMSTLIGVVAIGMTVQVVARVMLSLPVTINEEEAESEVVPSEVMYLTRVPSVAKRRRQKSPTRVSKKVVELKAEDKE